MKRLPADVRDGLRESIREMVAGGFVSDDVIAGRAVEWAADSSDYTLDDLLPTAKRLTAKAAADHRREQKTWPGVTDCDRLDAAFAALETAGVLARQDYAECEADGLSQIADELKDAKKAGRPARGYTFYHFDSTDEAVEGHGLHLSHGATGRGSLAARKIAAEIVATLTAHGLKPEWDGNPDRRVFVPLVWQRRR